MGSSLANPDRPLHHDPPAPCVTPPAPCVTPPARCVTPPTRCVPKTFRALAAFFAIGPLVLLGVASGLSPNQDGLGTHQQLGLPPCSMRVIVGIRCPACGMTTSWAHFVRGQWTSSLRANPGGFLLALYCIPFVVASAWSAKYGRVPHLTIQRVMVITLLAIAVVAIIDWFFRVGSGKLLALIGA
ncbi:MAG: DUF2752 domain-containing protein [Pirellulaceae bacterium]|nr:DUF2752 domain-containing protein [Pirellulaceae bacterium]